MHDEVDGAKICCEIRGARLTYGTVRLPYFPEWFIVVCRERNSLVDAVGLTPQNSEALLEGGFVFVG